MQLTAAIVAVLLSAGLAFADTTTRPARQVRVAVCQILAVDGDREGNFRRITYALEQAVKDKADIACFPESCLLGWENPEAHKLAAPIPGADSERIAELAGKYGLMIAIGLDEKDGDKLYDSAILVDKNGKILLKHRKINVLPELMDPPYATGRPEDIAAVDTPLGRIGMVICADTFTDDYIKRMAALKPELVLVPYGWAATNDKWPGHAKNLEKLVCKIAKAWSCPVVGTDLVGAISHGPWTGRTYGGASIVAGADGKTLEVLRDRDVDVKTLALTLGKAKPTPRVALEIGRNSEDWGQIIIELDAEKAPLTVRNFLRYVEDGYYDGTIFHRVIPSFMIQGGGYTAIGREKGGQHEPIQNESRNGLSNLAGTISMARTADPHSATSQFFINVADNSQRLDAREPRWGYAVFGKVVEGMEVVHRIRDVDTKVNPEMPGEKSQPVDPPMIRKALVVR